MLIEFYRAVVESLLTFFITVWYGNITSDEHARLNSIIRTASKITGATLEPLEEIYKKRSDKKMKCILKCTDHSANKIFKVLPSGKRFKSFKSKTKRFSNSFYVRAARDMKPDWLCTVRVWGLLCMFSYGWVFTHEPQQVYGYQACAALCVYVDALSIAFYVSEQFIQCLLITHYCT